MRPQGTPYRLRQMAGDFGVAAANIRARAGELQQAGAAAPADWGWSGPAAAAYSKTWQGWKNAAEVVADRMDSNLPGARQVLNRMADELEEAQRLYDEAVTTAQALGLAVDAKGYITPRSVASPARLAAGSPEDQIEQQLESAVKLGQRAFDWARDGLHWIFMDGDWEKTIGRINTILSVPENLLTVVQTGPSIGAGYGLVRAGTGRLPPAEAARLFNEVVQPVGLAYGRGEATAEELFAAAAIGMRRIEAASVFFKTVAGWNFVGGGARAGGALDIIGKLAVPLAVIGDYYTFKDPGPGPEWLQKTNQVAAVYNAAAVATVYVVAPASEYLVTALAINASVDWIPVVGEVVLVASAVVLTAIWAYQNVQPFHDFVNTAVSDTVHVAQETWNAASQGVSTVTNDVTNQVSNIGNSVQNTVNTVGNTAHALQNFFHWP